MLVSAVLLLRRRRTFGQTVSSCHVMLGLVLRSPTLATLEDLSRCGLSCILEISGSQGQGLQGGFMPTSALSHFPAGSVGI